MSASIIQDGEWKDDLQGTPQGAVVSPILANVYLHYVLDLCERHQLHDDRAWLSMGECGAAGRSHRVHVLPLVAVSRR